MRAPAALLLASLPACFIEPARPACHTPSDGTASDDFTDSEGICGTWGFEFGDASTMSVGGGLFSITVPTTVQTGAGCTSKPTSLADVSFVEVTAVAQGNTAYTEFIACPPVSQCGIGFNILGGKLQFRHIDNTLVAEAPYDSTAMRWLALTRSGSKVYGAYASEPGAWIDFGSTTVAMDPLRLTLSAGSYGNDGGGQTSTFAHFNVCP